MNDDWEFVSIRVSSKKKVFMTTWSMLSGNRNNCQSIKFYVKPTIERERENRSSGKTSAFNYDQNIIQFKKKWNAKARQLCQYWADCKSRYWLRAKLISWHFILVFFFVKTFGFENRFFNFSEMKIGSTNIGQIAVTMKLLAKVGEHTSISDDLYPSEKFMLGLYAKAYAVA